MCNWWYVLIGVGVLFITAVVLAIVWWNSVNVSYDASEGMGIAAIFLGCVILVLGIVCIACSTTAKSKYYKQKERYKYVMQVVDKMNDYQYANFGITETILDYNQWLESAKAKKQAFGNWSFYCNIPVEELNYIGLGGANDSNTD